MIFYCLLPLWLELEFVKDTEVCCVHETGCRRLKKRVHVNVDIFITRWILCVIFCLRFAHFDIIEVGTINFGKNLLC